MRFRAYKFSLLEFVLAFFLISILTTTLLNGLIFFQSIILKQQYLHKESLKKIYFQNKLKKMLFSKDAYEKKILCLDHGIQFYFDNGINFNAEHSGKCLAKLEYKKDHLLLSIYKSSDEKIREERFFYPLKSCQFLWGQLIEHELIFSKHYNPNYSLAALKISLCFDQKKQKGQSECEFTFAL